MNEKVYAVVVLNTKHIRDKAVPSNCKATYSDAIAYAAKQLAGDSTLTKAFICEVIEVVERASPPIITRKPVETATNNTGREWPTDSDNGETFTAVRDYDHG